MAWLMSGIEGATGCGIAWAGWTVDDIAGCTETLITRYHEYYEDMSEIPRGAGCDGKGAFEVDVESRESIVAAEVCGSVHQRPEERTLNIGHLGRLRLRRVDVCGGATHLRRW